MQEITCRRHGPFFNVPLGLRPQRIKLYALEPEKKNGCAEVGERPRNAGMSGSDGHEFGFSVVFGVPRVHGTRCQVNIWFMVCHAPAQIYSEIRRLRSTLFCHFRQASVMGRDQFTHATFYIEAFWPRQRVRLLLL